MSKIILILGIILTVMIFEKNPLLGIAIIGICILVKFLKKEHDANKKLIKSQNKNTINIIFTIEKGCEKISQAITATRHPKHEFETEYGTTDEPKVKIYNRKTYRY